MLCRRLLLVPLLFGACAHRAAIPDDDFIPPVGPPIKAPKCDAAGPHVDVRIVGRTPGKPPMETLEVEFLVRNPLDRPVWFAYRTSDPLPSSANNIEVARMDDAQVWSFGEFPEVVARPIPAGAVVNLPREEFFHNRFERSEDVLLFANAVEVDGKPAERWFAEKRSAPKGGRVAVKFDQLCTQLLDGS
jgi:hypothetical protein